MTKNVLRCLAVIAVCAMMVLCIASPALAADFVACIDPVTLTEYEFMPADEFMGDLYAYTLPGDMVMLIFGCDTCVIWINDTSYTCSLGYDNGGTAYFGNMDLFDVDDGSAGDFPDTGEPFLFSPDEYGAYLILDFECEKLSFAVEPVYTDAPVNASITSGIGGVVRMAGKVVTALLSPDGALFGLLPVVGMAVGIGMVGWGIRKFKDCTWGF